MRLQTVPPPNLRPGFPRFALDVRRVSQEALETTDDLPLAEPVRMIRLDVQAVQLRQMQEATMDTRLRPACPSTNRSKEPTPTCYRSSKTEGGVEGGRIEQRSRNGGLLLEGRPDSREHRWFLRQILKKRSDGMNLKLFSSPRTAKQNQGCTKA